MTNNPNVAVAEPVWRPDPGRATATHMAAFHERVARAFAVPRGSYEALHRWSVDDPGAFWREVWDYTGVIGEPGSTVVEDPDRMPGARWFPEAELNFAENLLRRYDEGDAIVFWGEDQVERRLSHRELYDAVSRLSQALADAGVGPGDRVAGYLPNMPEAVIAMLATASLGAVWASCSPEFGVNGLLDRFGQIEPKVLLAADGTYYKGRWRDMMERLPAIADGLPTVKQIVIVPYTATPPAIGPVRDAVTLAAFVAPYTPGPIAYRRISFADPLYILFSSGTTGAPKCIVHSVGGSLIQHLKEHQLHTDIRRDDRVFYYTTCSWMMWNWLVSALASEATLMLYDGSPFHPQSSILFDYADAEGIDVFGVSAKYLEAAENAGLAPASTHRLASLRSVLSTGSPLRPESFDYVCRAISDDVHLASIAGGTDILSCFILGNPAAPVYRGEIQCAGLGMAVQVWDDQGRPVATGKKGELVCTRAFPSMPIGFWNDPDGERYQRAYFETYPGVWDHGDYVAPTPNGGFMVYGRSDAVLNPGGVRIGTGEIYRPVERMSEVEEAVVIGQEWDNDVRVVLFVRLREGVTLDDELAQRIREQIRADATPRHVPARIAQVHDIPRTANGKIVELAVRDVVHGRGVDNKASLANPEALAEFADRPELQA